MVSRLVKGVPGIHACTEQNHVDCFFLETRLKARLLIRHLFQREKMATGCLLRDSGLHGLLWSAGPMPTLGNKQVPNLGEGRGAQGSTV